MVEDDRRINLSDYGIHEPLGADPAVPQTLEDVIKQLESPYASIARDFTSQFKKPSMFEGFAATSEAEGLSEDDLNTTRTVMDSIQAIFESEEYKEGTPTRRKFENFINGINAGAVYIKRINGSFEEGKFVSLYRGFHIDDKDEYVANMVGMLGANLYMDQLISDQIEAGRKTGVGEYMEAAGDTLRASSFVLVSREEDGYRLRDFMDADAMIADGKLADFATLIFKRDDEVGEKDTDGDYHARNTLQSYLTIFAFMKKDALKSYRSRSHVEKESYKYASIFLGNISKLREESLRALYDPEHPDHDSVSDVIAKVLDNPETANLSLLFVMNGDVNEMYRKAKKLLEAEEDSRAGQLIMNAVDKEIEKKSATLVKAQDLPEIGAREIDEEHDYNAQRKRIIEIFSYTSNCMYELEGCDIESDLVTPPTQVNVRFAQGKAHVFDLELHYENEHGEESTVDFTIDCKRGEFEWSLLDDPEVETGYKNTLLKYSDSVLQVVLERAKEIKASKRKNVDSVQVNPSKHRMRGVSSKLKRAPFEGREEAKNVVSAASLELESEPAEEARISREIVMPNEDDLRSLLKKLDHMDRDIVVAKLNDFNERGVGRIQVLKKGGNSRKSGAGNALGKYVLTGRNGGGKGIRVLVERVGAIQGSETWAIVAVDYKANIYNGNKLDKI